MIGVPLWQLVMEVWEPHHPLSQGGGVMCGGGVLAVVVVVVYHHPHPVVAVSLEA